MTSVLTIDTTNNIENKIIKRVGRPNKVVLKFNTKQEEDDYNLKLKLKKREYIKNYKNNEYKNNQIGMKNKRKYYRNKQNAKLSNEFIKQLENDGYTENDIIVFCKCKVYLDKIESKITNDLFRLCLKN